MPCFLPDLNRKKLPLLDRKTLFKLYQTSSIFLGIAPCIEENFNFIDFRFEFNVAF